MFNNEYDGIFYYLSEFHKKCKQKQSKVLEKYDITLIEYHIMVIVMNLKEASQNDIAEKLNIDKAFISKKIKALEKKELIICSNNPNCKRKNTISLTGKANKILPELGKVYQENLESIFKELDNSEIMKLQNVLKELSDKL